MSFKNHPQVAYHSFIKNINNLQKFTEQIITYKQRNQQFAKNDKKKTVEEINKTKCNNYMFENDN